MLTHKITFIKNFLLLCFYSKNTIIKNFKVNWFLYKYKKYIFIYKIIPSIRIYYIYNI